MSAVEDLARDMFARVCVAQGASPSQALGLWETRTPEDRKVFLQFADFHVTQARLEYLEEVVRPVYVRGGIGTLESLVSMIDEHYVDISSLASEGFMEGFQAAFRMIGAVEESLRELLEKSSPKV